MQTIQIPVWAQTSVKTVELEIIEALINADFVQSKHDHSFFTVRKNTKLVIILVYVDDLLITENDADMIQEAKTILHKAFRIKDLGFLKYFLGIEVSRSQKGIVLCQRKYTVELIAELGLAWSKPAITPMEQNMKLTTVEYDAHCNLKDGPALTDVKGYQKLIGKLLYLTLTRPDFAYTVQTLSQFMQAPKKSHLEATHRLVRYLKNEPGLGILMSADGDMTLRAYYDADWANCPNSRKSVTSYLVKFGKSLIS
uniref:Uncharacterized mitochondrial protein AtMg00810-like n=1 Tax=Nicotiana tabacum TaxID=4097 RepID=A0A1S3ZR59_TOBAC|nr:PREDICTED: uncharacterized mitochondrial protein AtMg00810-like [Nicotiana tabacum]